MDTRLMAAVTSSLDGVNVTQLCKQQGISTKTFYKWRNRYVEEGLAGLYEKSRRPHSITVAFDESVVDRVVEVRRKLKTQGHDCGPTSIYSHLQDHDDGELPSIATIWRMLIERNEIIAEPKKRPKSSYVRFEAESPNEMWQIDFTEWRLSNRKVVYIFSIIDDHSRLLVNSVAVKSPTSQAAWEVFCAGIARWGLPVRCLSDNGVAFSGKIRGFEVFFEKQLRSAGIRPSTARPYHPQTCGKVERFQQTLKKWLKAQQRATNIAGLQNQLNAFAKHYNYKRRHQGIGRITPHKRWSDSPRATNKDTEVPSPILWGEGICVGGVMNAHGWRIGIGAEFSGKPGEVVIDGDFAIVFIEGQLVRSLQLDASRNYQSAGLSPGRRTKAS